MTGDAHGETTAPSAPPHLTVPEVGPATDAVALLLHGGRERSTARVRPWQATVLRMRPFAAAIRRHEADPDAPTVAVASLRYRQRGWNGDGGAALADVGWAIDALRGEVGARPVVLVGHSMGGRLALRCAGERAVVGAVALAPWLPRGEPVAHLRDRDVVLLHGARDRTTDPAATAAFADRAAAVARAVASFRIERTGHTMLARAPVWHDLTARFVGAIAAGTPIAAIEPVADGVWSTSGHPH